MLTTIWLHIEGVPCVWWTRTAGLGPGTPRWYAFGDHGLYSPIAWQEREMYKHVIKPIHWASGDTTYVCNTDKAVPRTKRRTGVGPTPEAAYAMWAQRQPT